MTISINQPKSQFSKTNSNVAAGLPAQLPTAAQGEKTAKSTYYKAVNYRPMGVRTKKFVNSMDKLFSFQTVKKIAPTFLIAGISFTLGGVTFALAGAHITAIAGAIVGSSLFPPIGIAIASTVVAIAVGYGLYRLLRHIKEKNAIDEAGKKQNGPDNLFADTNAVGNSDLAVQADNEDAQSIAPEDSVSNLGQAAAQQRPLAS